MAGCSMKAGLILVGVLGLGAQPAAAHGAMTIPKPRNSVDGDLPPYNGKVRGSHRFEYILSVRHARYA